VSDFPVDHLSASSLTTFMRCPRQWQDKYVHGNRGPSSEALLLGGFVHNMLEGTLKGEVPNAMETMDQTITDQGGLDNIDFNRLDEWKVYDLGLKMVYDYYETIGKWLDIEDTEVEISLDVPGVPIPVVGRVDFTTPDRIVDIKTTGYFSAKQVRVNKEWKFQANVYQLWQEKPAEFHVITRAKTDSIRVPADINDPLFVYPPDPDQTQMQIYQVYKLMEHCMDEYGDEFPFPGNPIHEWAGRYCSVENCCQR
jgi:CRISPR/Cas system-associated exonuclease Cas4 (RecB family)